MSQAMGRTIDLNCDVGEGIGHDAALIPLVSSANIACGAHAGSLSGMHEAIAIAREHGTAIGAHPGHRDLEHFGRREIPLSSDQATALVCEQVSFLEKTAGEPPHHIKLHGGLYHQVGRDDVLASAVASAVQAEWPQIVVVAMAGSVLAEIAQRQGLRVAREAFADRMYTKSGHLVPRSDAGASISDPRQASEQAVRLVAEQGVVIADGDTLPVHADTLCIHGDGENAIEIADAIRTALTQHSIVVRRFT